jgi:predicted O-methyltransferase YrrM
LYNRIQLAKKYLHYLFTASNGKGHGIHSPFVFDFITNVLRDKKKYNCYKPIESLRRALLKEEAIIEVEDFGAGSSVIKTNQRVIKDIAGSSLKPKKYAQLLHRMIRHYQPKTILELGTSFGITTSYLASAKKDARIFTCEGSASIAEVASGNFKKLELNNIHLWLGDFQKTFSPLVDELKQVDFAFIDGNHRKEPTLEYFYKLLEYSNPSTILVFDDIHWSAEMEQAWQAIQQHEVVTLTIDLFFIGIVCMNADIKEKQHFVLRY